MWNMKGKGTLKQGGVKGRETTELTEADKYAQIFSLSRMPTLMASNRHND